jgi:hypothetical protein
MSECCYGTQGCRQAAPTSQLPPRGGMCHVQSLSGGAGVFQFVGMCSMSLVCTHNTPCPFCSMVLPHQTLEPLALLSAPHERAWHGNFRATADSLAHHQRLLPATGCMVPSHQSVRPSALCSLMEAYTYIVSMHRCIRPLCCPPHLHSP